MTPQQKEALVQEEIVKVRAHMAQFRSSMGGFGTDVDAYVRATLGRHREQIERWGGLHYLGPRYTMDVLPQDVVNGTLMEIERNWMYARIFGVNNPNRVSLLRPYELYRSRTFNSETNVNDIEVMPGVSVRIRRGQSVARAVLREIRTRYEGTDSLYVQAFEDLFERLGHKWAAGNPISTTISVAPSSFIRLGNLCEGSSCHASGHGSTDYHKIRVSRYKGAVTYFFHRDLADGVPLENRLSRAEIRGRAWGFLADDAAWISNFYGLGQETVEYSLCRTAAAALGLPEGSLLQRGAGRCSYMPYNTQCNGDVSVLHLPNRTMRAEQEKFRYLEYGYGSDFISDERIRMTTAEERDWFRLDPTPQMVAGVTSDLVTV